MKKILWIIGLLIFISSCESGSNIPENPENFEISVRYNGGMLYYSEGYNISYDSCMYFVNREGAIQKLTFKLPKEKVDSLYQLFIDNDFAKIEMRNEDVYDRGGTSITLKIDDKFIKKVNSGNYFVTDKYLPAYNNILYSIEKVVKAEVEKFKKEIVIDTANVNVSQIKINWQIVYSNADSSLNKLPVKIKLLNEQNLISCLDENGEFYRTILPLLPKNDTIKINKLKNGEIFFENYKNK